jgi:hypothetical protein
VSGRKPIRSLTRSRAATAAGALLCAVVLLALMASGCDWFDKAVDTNLPPDTWMISCPSSEGTSVGEDVVFQWGASDPDGSVSRYAWTYDDTLSGDTTDAEKAVESVTEGMHTFTVAAIDAEGEADPTPAECIFTVAQGGHLVDRVVLAEMMTTKICANCPTAEQALDELVQEYGPAELCVIAYHYDDGTLYHDAVATDASTARIDWYFSNNQGFPGEIQFPVVVFDGGRCVVGANTVSGSKADYGTEIDLRRAVGSPVSLSLQGQIGGSSGSVSATVTVEDALPPGNYVVRMAVIESGLIVGADHFDFVPRLLLEEEPLSVGGVGEDVVVNRQFTVDPSWNPVNMDVIAFVQNDETLEVIQAGRLSAR